MEKFTKAERKEIYKKCLAAESKKYGGAGIFMTSKTTVDTSIDDFDFNEFPEINLFQSIYIGFSWSDIGYSKKTIHEMRLTALCFCINMCE